MPLIMLPMQEVIYVANVREYSYIVPLLCGKCQRVFIHCAIIMLLMSESIHTLCHYYVANVREYSYIVPLLCCKCQRYWVFIHCTIIMWQMLEIIYTTFVCVRSALCWSVGCRSGGGSGGGMLEWVCWSVGCVWLFNVCEIWELWECVSVCSSGVGCV